MDISRFYICLKPRTCASHALGGIISNNISFSIRSYLQVCFVLVAGGNPGSSALRLFFFLPPTQPRGRPRSRMPLPPWLCLGRGALFRLEPGAGRRGRSHPEGLRTRLLCLGGSWWAAPPGRDSLRRRTWTSVSTPPFPHFVDQFGLNSKESVVPLEPILPPLPLG